MRLAAPYALALALCGCAPERPAPGAAAGPPTPAPALSPTPAGGVPAGEASPAAEAGFRRWEVSEVLAAFRGAGLGAEGAAPLAPSAAERFAAGVEFDVPAAGGAGRGRVLSFDSVGSLEAAVESYAGAGEFSWVYVKDNVVVRLDGRVPEETARRYESALTAMQ